MGSAKDIRVEPIGAQIANAFVRRVHYSGKTTQNSQLHLGAFLDRRLHGVMQFGPSIQKDKTQGLVGGTQWNEFIELNRLAFGDGLPRNSESRCLSIAFRLIKANAPHIKWVISYADACQCGDGTIYRASGFALTQIKKNTTMLKMPNGDIVADKTLNNSPRQRAGYWKKMGATPLPGFQLRYIYFLEPTAKERLTVPILPYSAIAEAGAKMYKGVRPTGELVSQGTSSAK